MTPTRAGVACSDSAWARFERSQGVVEAAFAGEARADAKSEILESIEWLGPPGVLDTVVLQIEVEGTSQGDGADGYGMCYAQILVVGFGGRGVGGLLNYGDPQPFTAVLEERRPLLSGEILRMYYSAFAEGDAGGRSWVRARFRAFPARPGMELKRCPVSAPVHTTPASWGRVKSIYRR